MATNFPTSLDSLTNPTATSTLSSPSHSAQHADANDAIEALEAKVGVNNSAVTTSLDYRVRNPELVGGGARPLLTGGAYIDGTNGLVLSGLSGNYASTPDSAALSITGDIDIKCKVTMTDWTPATAQVLVAKWSTSGNRTFVFQIVNTGVVRLVASSTGSNVIIAADSTVATGLADGATKWVRCTLDVDDGAGNRVAKFYLSDDGTTWTQLGTTVTTAGTVSFFDSTALLEIGSSQTGASEQLNGTVGRVIIQSAYDTADNTTSVVFDADFSAEAADTLAFTEDSTNAATVSVTTTRYTYGIPSAPLLSVSTTSWSQNLDRYQPFTVNDSVDVDMFAFEVTTGPASAATVYLGIYEATFDFQPTGSPLATATVAVGTSATGAFYTQITPVTLPPGNYVIGSNPSVNMLMRDYRYGHEGVLHSFGANSMVNQTRKARTAGTFGTAVPWDAITGFTIGASHPILLRWKAA